MIYVISDGTNYKIGYSQNPEKRLKQLQTGQPQKLTLIAVFDGDKKKKRLIHHLLRRLKVRGEWFRFDCEITEIIELIDLILNPK